ncbi:hypothetical protein INR49_007508 [Caranx melampygus]|nr:hypothetical protein INR49_007508 [Caranx melampygus]
MAGALEGDLFIGPQAEEHRGLLSVRYPMEHGIVKDWNDMERIWQYVYSKEQLQTFSEEHPVLLTEAPLNPSKNREKAAEVFFETFNVPALFISMQAVLSLYATGRTTGVVLDSGDGVTHVVPIYEGFAIPHSIMRVDIAAGTCPATSACCCCARKATTSTPRQSSRCPHHQRGKDGGRACYLSLNPQKDETLETERLSTSSRWKHFKYRTGPVPSSRAALQTRPDRRRELGDPRGFGERLLTEVKKLAPKDVKIKERLYSTWIGGSILASLDTFKKMLVSKREYEEDRARAIHRKTF